MVLSPIGEIVAAEWEGIARRRRDVTLDEWVVMPNHIHGILVLQERGTGPNRRDAPSKRDGDLIAQDVNATGRGAPAPMQRGVSTASRLQAGSLGAIIGQFKSRATKRVWRSGYHDFGWQPRFYDHIIRDEDSLNDIRQYIIDNAQKWDPSEAVPENLWM